MSFLWHIIQKTFLTPWPKTRKKALKTDILSAREFVLKTNLVGLLQIIHGFVCDRLALSGSNTIALEAVDPVMPVPSRILSRAGTRWGLSLLLVLIIPTLLIQDVRVDARSSKPRSNQVTNKILCIYYLVALSQSSPVKPLVNLAVLPYIVAAGYNALI